MPADQTEKCPALGDHAPEGLILGSFNSLAFRCGCEPRIDYHLMNFVSRLFDDDLQVQIGHPRHGNGLRSGAWHRRKYDQKARAVPQRRARHVTASTSVRML